MMYILTEEEYQELKIKQQYDLSMSKAKLQKLCTLIANTMPVKWGWSKGEEAKPWTCILTQKDGDEWYCDSCPVQDICPLEYKHYSK